MTPSSIWRLLIGLLLMPWLTSCGGGGDDAPAPTGALRLDRAAAVTQTIGPEGGTLTTTAADGSVYTLSVPASALPTRVAITLTPIAAIDDLPRGAGLLGGAHLTPEGQTFNAPARLSVTPSRPASGAPVPYAYVGEGTQRHLYPARMAGGTIEYEIAHFSGYAALQAELGEVLDNVYFPQPSAAGDQALQNLVAAAVGMPAGAARSEAMRAALQGWLDGTIKAAAAATQAIATYDEQAFALGSVFMLRREMSVFDIAVKYATLELAGAAIDPLSAEFRTSVKDTAQHVIGVSNAGCTAANAAALVVPEILAWQALAQRSGAADLEVALQRSAVLEALCLQVAYDENGGLDFPTGIQPGQSGTLSVRAGYRVHGGPVQYDRPMRVDAVGTNTATSVLTGAGIPVAAGATYTQAFLWQPATSELRIDVTACMQAFPDVCQDGFVVRGVPTDTCPLFRLTVPGNSRTTRSFSGLSLGYANGGGAIGGSNVLSLTAFAGTLSAESTLYFKVETEPPSGEPIDIVVTWSGDATVEAGSARVNMQVNGTSASASALATGPLLMQAATRVRHDDLIKMTFSASAESPAIDKNVNPRGSMITNIPGVVLRPVICE